MNGYRLTARKLRYPLNIWICTEPPNHGIVIAVVQVNGLSGAKSMHDPKIQRGELAAAVIAFSFVEIGALALS